MVFVGDFMSERLDTLVMYNVLVDVDYINF